MIVLSNVNFPIPLTPFISSLSPDLRNKDRLLIKGVLLGFIIKKVSIIIAVNSRVPIN